MHSTLLTRSAVAVASLAIGSVALGAAPATADVPSGVTRQTVLAAAKDTDGPDALALAKSVCKTDSDEFRAADFFRSEDVEGLLISVYVPPATESESDAPRFCTFAVFAPTAPFATLSGSTTISVSPAEIDTLSAQAVAPSQTFSLSGDVYVTDVLTDQAYAFNADGTASGDVIKVEQATTANTRVSTPKSTEYKAAALKSYKRTVAKAQTKLAKALKRAGDSTSKKAAARKAFTTRKKAAKATLHIRWSSDKKTVVTTTVGATTKTPFDIATFNVG